MSEIKQRFFLVAFCLGVQSVQASNNDMSTSTGPKPQKASQSIPTFAVRPVVSFPKSTAPTKNLTHEEIDWGPYMAQMQRRIKRNLHPPKGYDFHRTPDIVFKILRDGSVSSVRLLHSSGNKEVDQSFIEAITAAEPFAPLPKGSKDEIEIPYHPIWCSVGSGAFSSFKQAK